MKYLRNGAAAVFAIGIFALSAAPAPAVLPDMGHHGNRHIAGQYSGTVTDSALGTGTAAVNLAASEESVGGWFAFTFGSATYANPAAASPNFRGVQGAFVATIASSACTFAFRANYDPTSFVLSGKYRAVNGCSGESGSFSVTEQCYYDEQRDVRRLGGGLMPC